MRLDFESIFLKQYFISHSFCGLTIYFYIKFVFLAWQFVNFISAWIWSYIFWNCILIRIHFAVGQFTFIARSLFGLTICKIHCGLNWNLYFWNFILFRICFAVGQLTFISSSLFGLTICKIHCGLNWKLYFWNSILFRILFTVGQFTFISSSFLAWQFVNFIAAWIGNYTFEQYFI